MSVVEPSVGFHGFQYGSYLLKLLAKQEFRENRLSIVFLLAVLNKSLAEYLRVVMLKSKHRYSEERQGNGALYCTFLLQYELKSA
jgi:hypothetical protein